MFSALPLRTDTMEKIKAKMQSLRAENDEALATIEDLKAQLKEATAQATAVRPLHRGIASIVARAGRLARADSRAQTRAPRLARPDSHAQTHAPKPNPTHQSENEVQQVQRKLTKTEDDLEDAEGTDRLRRPSLTTPSPA